MKKFLLKVSIFAAFAFFVQVITPVYVDPFNVFHWEHIRDNGIEPNKNYVKMKYILANPEKFDSFLFGSSRVAAIHTENITGEKCYNMTISTGLPGWHLLNIKTLFRNGIIPKKIYIGVDTVSYTGDYELQSNEPMRCPYEYLDDDIMRFARLYFAPRSALSSLNTTLKFLLNKNSVVTDAEIFYGSSHMNTRLILTGATNAILTLILTAMFIITAAETSRTYLLRWTFSERPQKFAANMAQN